MFKLTERRTNRRVMAGALASALGYPPSFLFAAVIAIVTGLLITLYRKAL
jgi:hypothetical protein